METSTQNYNRIFQYTVTGVLLLIAAMVFILSNLSNITSVNLPYTAAASVLAASAISLLYKAIKEDNTRLRAA